MSIYTKSGREYYSPLSKHFSNFTSFHHFLYSRYFRKKKTHRSLGRWICSSQIQSRPSEIRMEIETPPMEVGNSIQVCERVWWQGDRYVKDIHIQKKIQDMWDLIAAGWERRKGSWRLVIQWSCAGVPEKMHYILDDPLSITSRMPTCSSFLGGASTYIFPETWDMHDLLAKTAMIREEIHYFGTPLVGRGGGCAPLIGYSLGRKAIWALSCFYGSCLAFAAPMTAKCVSEASMSWRLGMLVRSERKTAAVLQTSTSLEVCEGTLVMLAVCCGRVHVLSCSGFRNSDIFSCGWIACKWGFTAFSHEDHWWIVVFHRCLDIYGKRTGSCGKKEVFMESGYEWSEDLAARPNFRKNSKEGWRFGTRSREEERCNITKHTVAYKQMPTFRNLWWMVGTRCQGVGISVVDILCGLPPLSSVYVTTDTCLRRLLRKRATAPRTQPFLWSPVLQKLKAFVSLVEWCCRSVHLHHPWKDIKDKINKLKSGFMQWPDSYGPSMT